MGMEHKWETASSPRRPFNDGGMYFIKVIF